jgi:quinol monooxygenase YgiN
MSARQGIAAGKLEEFKELSAPLTAGVEASEPTTLGYEWFIDGDGDSCYLVDAYGSSADFLLHFNNLGAKLEQMLAISPLEEMIVLGDPDDQVKEMLSHLGAKFYRSHVGFTR